MVKCYYLRFLFLESNSGWVPFWLNRLEKYYEALQSIFCDEHPLKDVDHNQTKVNSSQINGFCDWFHKTT